MIDRRKRAFRESDVHTLLAQHVESRSRGDFVNQVQPDEKLCLPGGENPDGVGFPNLIVECPSGHS